MFYSMDWVQRNGETQKLEKLGQRDSTSVEGLNAENQLWRWENSAVVFIPSKPQVSDIMGSDYCFSEKVAHFFLCLCVCER